MPITGLEQPCLSVFESIVAMPPREIQSAIEYSHLLQGRKVNDEVLVRKLPFRESVMIDQYTFWRVQETREVNVHTALIAE